MAYREDLEAAQHQIRLLEGELRDLRQGSEERERALRAEIDAPRRKSGPRPAKTRCAASSRRSRSCSDTR